MKIVVVDPMMMPYDISTPYTKPLGGTQSAICYLMEELGKKNHELYLYNHHNLENDSVVSGVKMRNVNNYSTIKDINPDIVIVSSSPDLTVKMKSEFGLKCPFVLWTQHDYDQAHCEGLKKKHIRDMIDYYIFVSEWHKHRMIKQFGIPMEKSFVLKNGIAKSFEKYLDSDTEKVPRSMIYCSVPWRGLSHIPVIIPEIRKEYPDCQMNVYSSMNIYHTEDNDNMKELLNRVKTTPGIVYSPGVSQSELAEAMSKCEILAYPNTFPETSCITALQAMAAGCIVVSSDLGALHETTNGQNLLVHLSEEYMNSEQYYTDYCNNIKRVFDMSSREKANLIAKNKAFIKENHTWSGQTSKFLRMCVEMINGLNNFHLLKYGINLQLGLEFFKKGEYDKAIQHYNILQWYKNINDAFNTYLNKGVSFYNQKRQKEAIDCFTACNEIQDTFVAHKNLALLHLEMGNRKKFYECGFKALEYEYNPIFANHLANNLETEHRYLESKNIYENLIMIQNDNLVALNNLANINKIFYAMNPNIEITSLYWRSLQLCDKAGMNREKEVVFSNILLSNLYNAKMTETQQAAVANKWTELFPLKKELLDICAKYSKSENSKIRVGYLSSDFICHPVGYMFDSILSNHDMNKYEIICYDNSTTWKNDFVAQKLRGYNKAKWVQINAMTDAQVLETMMQDNLDILVDMMGHTRNTRVALLEYKPAKVIVNYFAYPATSGMKAVDYKISDKYATPLDMCQQYYSEKLWLMPQGFQCYTPPLELNGEKRNNHGDTINLCCFNNPHKFNKEQLDTFVAILKRLPNAKLFLRYLFFQSSYVREIYYHYFERNGIPRSQLDIGYVPILQCMDMYRDMDIALDTFPYNGGTISSEALYMNTPIITLEGSNYVSRVGVSLLSNLGLEKYVAKSKDDYIEKVVELANNKTELLGLHKTIRNKMLESDLGNAVSFTKHFEEAFDGMMKEWKMKNPLVI